MGGSSSSSKSVQKTYNRRTQIAAPVKLAAQGNEGNLQSQVLAGLTAAEGGNIEITTYTTDQGTVRAAAHIANRAIGAQHETAGQALNLAGNVSENAYQFAEGVNEQAYDLAGNALHQLGETTEQALENAQETYQNAIGQIQNSAANALTAIRGVISGQSETQQTIRGIAIIGGILGLTVWLLSRSQS